MAVAFHGQPVDEACFARSDKPIQLGGQGALALPPPHEGESMAQLRWDGPEVLVVRDHAGHEAVIDPTRKARVQSGPVTLDVSLVRQFRHPNDFWGDGDLMMIAALLVMMVSGMWAAAVLEQLAGEASQPRAEVSPELIARLLDDDLEGADRGYLAERRERPQAEKAHEQVFLPAGRVGPLDALGGAEQTAPETRRLPEVAEQQQSRYQPLPTHERDEAADEPGPDLPEVADPLNLDGDDGDQLDEQEAAETPAEEERGWGFTDWYDAEDARSDERDIAEQIRQARQRLRIEPDDPWALQHLGYYQYLAEDYDGCADTYQHFVDLFPSDPAGYNNLALVYKRTGEYPREEGYYRLALALDPNDDHALNNLAVNLAHQERYDEALAIMEKLETLIPDDPYADLHRAKIHAARGEDESAYDYLEEALEGMENLDTLHHIEFRQDIRIDPAFRTLRNERRFEKLLVRYYGKDAAPLVGAHG